MWRYLARALITRVRSDVVLYVLTVFGVALGVASVASIRVLSAGAVGAFAGTVDALGSDVAVSVVGSEPTFPDSLFLTAFETPGVEIARPICEISVTLGEDPARFLDVIGVDFLNVPPLPVSLDDGEGILDALHVPGWAAVSPDAAREHGWSPGDSIRVASGSRFATLVVGALVDFKRSNALAAPNLVLMDVAQVHAVFGMTGRLSRIDLVLASDADVESVMRSLRRRLPTYARLLTPERRLEEANNLLSAFRLNLFALSLVSLVVGAYIVYGAVTASLVRRRRELGVLRSTGATQPQVLGLILAEVAVLAGLGSALGIFLGYASAMRNVDTVSETVTNLYLLSEIRSLSVSPDTIGLGLLVGIGAALAAVAAPAWELSHRPVRVLLSSVSPRARLAHLAPRLAATGVALVVVALIAGVFVGQTWRPWGFVLSLVTLAFVTLVTPLTLVVLPRFIPRRGFGLGFSIGNLASRLGSATTAVGALAASVSMVVGVTVMVTSFRTSLVGWIDRTVRADIYVTTPSWARSSAEAALDPDLIEELATFEGVAWMDRLRQVTIRTEEGRFRMNGVDFSTRRGGRMSRDDRLQLVSGSTDGLRERMEGGGGLISEPLSRKRELGVGDTLRVEGAAGEFAFPVVGVYTDYSSEWGAALIDLAIFGRAFGPGDPQSVALYLHDPEATPAVIEAIRARFTTSALVIRSNRRLRDESLALFDQTFAITDALKFIAAMVAVSGVTLTLLVWTRERGRELALYRALGARGAQLFRLFVGEGLSLGLVGVGLGSLGGVALAVILVEVINRTYFGWSIQMTWPWLELAAEMGGVLLAALLASLYPAVVARSVTTAALTEERQ